MSLKRKINSYNAARARMNQLEKEIRKEAEPVLRQQGLLAMPRFERILAHFN